MRHWRALLTAENLMQKGLRPTFKRNVVNFSPGSTAVRSLRNSTRSFMVRLLLFSSLILLCCAAEVPAENRAFSKFSVDLPQGWTGEEQTAFSVGRDDEYMLVLGKRDEAGEKFLAQVSIFLLPNLPKDSAENFAKKMAELQSDASEPRKQGNFWRFAGEPRSQSFKARANNYVTATPERILIIIAQDPHNLGADKIIASLKGLQPDARELLGR